MSGNRKQRVDEKVDALVMEMKSRTGKLTPEGIRHIAELRVDIEDVQGHVIHISKKVRPSGQRK
jgi:hypothetical protein